MRVIPRLLAVVATSALLAAPAAAQSYSFTLTGANTGYFTLTASPVPDVIVAGLYFQFNNVAVTQPDGSSSECLFYFADSGVLLGGLSLARICNGGLALYGPQLFTGTFQAPTFVLGTFQLGPRNVTPDTWLTIATVVPEPSGALLLGAGLAGLAAARRRRRATTP